MSAELLVNIWFLLLGVLLTGYAILDGFDLGVGILHPFVSRDDKERRIVLNSIGPLWDGNEVWLVTFGGALFAAFPGAYATAFSAFYAAFMFLLFALIFRAVSLEFRSKVSSVGWRRFWDLAFSASSTLATFLFGVAVGNAMLGLPLDQRGTFLGTLGDQLSPYTILVGLFTVSLFALHGGLFLYLKTEGALQERIRTWQWRTFGLFLVSYMLVTIYTLMEVPRATANFEETPWAGALIVVTVLAVANIPRSIYWDRPALAFLSSCAAIAGLTSLFGLALYPNLVSASNDPALSVSIFNSGSSTKTLSIMLLIAGIGMPFVVAYTSIIYWAFRGKVTLSEQSY